MGKLVFIVFALPRTRSFWLSKFLSYKGLVCEHDYLDLIDLEPWMIGTIETGQIPFWRDIKKTYPDAKVVTLRRPIHEIVSSLQEMEVPRKESDIIDDMEYLSICMDNLERAYPDTLTVTYEELDTEEGCKKIFEFIMQVPFDREWWLSMKDENLQVDKNKVLEAFHV